MSLILRTVPNSRDIASCEECLGTLQLTNIFLLWLVANNITIMHLCSGKGHIFVGLGNNLVLYATLYYNMCSTHLNIDFSTLELQQCGYDLCRHISSERKRINSLIGYISLGIELWIRLNKCFFGYFGTIKNLLLGKYGVSATWGKKCCRMLHVSSGEAGEKMLITENYNSIQMTKPSSRQNYRQI